MPPGSWRAWPLRRRGRDAAATRGWTTLLSTGDGLPFLIDDGTGRALIEPTDAHVSLVADVTLGDDVNLADPSDRARMFLARHGVSSGIKRLRFEEGIIEPGEVVAVAGAGMREPDPDGAASMTGYRDLPATRLRLSATPRAPLYISDRPGTTH